jgi:salicylate hydroxylase
MERLSKHQRRYVQAGWVGPRAHCTVYPVRWQGSELLTFSGQVEQEGWEAESWSQKGKVDDCVRDFVGWHEDVVEMVSNVETLHKWGIFVRDPLPRWSVGRVTLLGDACHSMVPYLGQGVNTAIEDAYVLTRCLEQQPDDPPQALSRYEAARIERANKAVRESLAMQPVLHNPALAEPRTASEYVDRTWSPAQFKARQDWIYSYDATQVPI